MRHFIIYSYATPTNEFLSPDIVSLASNARAAYHLLKDTTFGLIFLQVENLTESQLPAFAYQIARHRFSGRNVKVKRDSPFWELSLLNGLPASSFYNDDVPHMHRAYYYGREIARGLFPAAPSWLQDLANTNLSLGE